MNKKGFTLVEMAIVLVIIGVLAALTVSNIGGFGKKARDQRRINDLLKISSAVINYFNSKGFLPSPTDTNKVPFSELGMTPINDPVGWPYYYTTSSALKFYLTSCVESGETAVASPINSTSLCFVTGTSPCPGSSRGFYCIEVAP